MSEGGGDRDGVKDCWEVIGCGVNAVGGVGVGCRVGTVCKGVGRVSNGSGLIMGRRCLAEADGSGFCTVVRRRSLL